MASLLGAHLLDETCIPVLPRRMNRNVRAFLTLYGVDLPFVEAPDLANEPVEAVTLVDTQSIVSVKGMSSHTRVHVVDHHPLRDDLPSDWIITVSGTGANTTLFIETLRERDTLLNMIQSTLLLLGVYEDTGSLTYTRTTARDLRAASYLLDQGASLQIASDFLNHPLSKNQQDLYDYLHKNAEHYRIQGYTIVVACGDAQEMDEELSTVAHKLRDLLDPDALIILITTRGGVQLIARSTTDNIDVAQLAALFGGGGHERAAASLVKERELQDVHQELIQHLPEIVQPAVTVSQIMSRGPQLLTPETQVEEAVNRMQRYGHEGYPVVRDGKVIGLLTRRAVDRAVTHKLNLTAASLMDAGEFYVNPDDSIEHLQRIMVETGWGQIPVVQPESAQIIGIVTRTDLLKTLTPRPRIPSRHNLASRLTTALPPARLALLETLSEEAFRQRVVIYIVGGFVRDLLLDRPSLDFDLVVEGEAIVFARALASKLGGRVTSHTRFGTAKWLLHEPSRTGGQTAVEALRSIMPASVVNELPETLDFVSARTEFYTYPTALPTVERGSIKLDLHRRDFTINTLALRLDGNHYGELHDYWGGLNDLRQGLVRVLHSLSFVDDPTRILRAVRFEQRFDFRIDRRTLELLREAIPLLGRVSGDRIRHELNNILVEAQVSQILTRLNDLMVLREIHPSLTWDAWIQMKSAELMTAGLDPVWFGTQANEDPNRVISMLYLLWFIQMPPETAVIVSERLKLPADLRRTVQSACQLWNELSSLQICLPAR